MQHETDSFCWTRNASLKKSSLETTILCYISSKMNAFETLLHGGSYRSCCTPLSPFSPIIFHFLTWLTKQNGRNVDQREGEELYRLLGLIAAKPIFPNFRVYTQLECSIRLKAQLKTFFHVLLPSVVSLRNPANLISL